MPRAHVAPMEGSQEGEASRKTRRPPGITSRAFRVLGRVRFLEQHQRSLVNIDTRHLVRKRPTESNRRDLDHLDHVFVSHLIVVNMVNIIPKRCRLLVWWK